MIDKMARGAFLALLCSAGPAVADDLRLTPAEHTPIACDQRVAVESLADYPVPKAKKPYRIVISIPSFANPYMQGLTYGVEQAAAKAGVTVSYVAGKGFMDPASQITQIENALTRRPNAMLVNPADPDGLVGSIDDAVESGVPVIDIGTLSNSAKSINLVQDDYTQGVIAADTLAKLLPKGGEGILMGGPANASWARRRVAGFLDEIRKYPTLTVSAVTNQDIKPEEGVIKFANAAQAHPKVDWIYATGSFLLPPPSIPSEYRRAVYVAGSLTDVTEEALKDGTIAAVLPDFPVSVGYIGVALAVAKLNGDAVAHQTCMPDAAMTRADLKDPVWVGTSTAPRDWIVPSK